MNKKMVILAAAGLCLSGCGLGGNSPAASRGFNPEGNVTQSEVYLASPIGSVQEASSRSVSRQEVLPADSVVATDVSPRAVSAENARAVSTSSEAASADPVFVAVVETISDGVIPPNETQYLTDVLREEAVKVLDPNLNYTIMTRENIQAMLPPDKNIEDCEGSCLVETGRNIAANYVVQARVSTFGSDLTITVELYDTRTGKLMSSFSAKNPDVNTLEVEIRQKSPAMFHQVLKAESN